MQAPLPGGRYVIRISIDWRACWWLITTMLSRPDELFTPTVSVSEWEYSDKSKFPTLPGSLRRLVALIGIFEPQYLDSLFKDNVHGNSFGIQAFQIGF